MPATLSPILKAAKEILETAGRKGLHIDQITDLAVAQHNNLGLSPENFKKKVQAALLANTKLKATNPTFAQVKWDTGARKGKPRQGWYRLKEQRILPAPSTISTPQVPTAFFGKAGEYAVMSELLFWGYNASIMTVDDGIDIVANRDSKFFHIQVKTSGKNTGGKFHFHISNVSFKKYHSSHVFYVFVLRSDTSNEYIIIPSVQIAIYLKTHTASDSKDLSLTITRDDKKTKYLLNGEHDITACYGRFGDIIK